TARELLPADEIVGDPEDVFGRDQVPGIAEVPCKIGKAFRIPECVGELAPARMVKVAPGEQFKRIALLSKGGGDLQTAIEHTTYRLDIPLRIHHRGCERQLQQQR